MRLISTLLLSSALASVIAGCNASSGETADFVAVLPITGEFRTKGYAHKTAVQDAIVRLEAGGATDQIGKPITLTLIDSGDNAEAVTQALEEVLAEKEVLGIVSSAGAAHEGSLRPAMREHIPHFEVSSGSDDEEFLNGAERQELDMSYAFMTRGLCHTEAILTARFMVAKYPGGRIALVRGNKAHDIMHTEVIRQELDRLNAVAVSEGRDDDVVTVVNAPESEDSEYALSYEVGSFQLELEMVRSDHEPDAIFWHLRGDSTNLRFMQDAQGAGFEGDLITCGMSRTNELLDDELNGGYLDYFADRLYFVMRAPPQTPELAQYKQEFLDNWGVVADTYTPAAFDAMTLMGLSLASTGGVGNADLRDAVVDTSRRGERKTFTDLNGAFEKVAAGEDVNYDGPSGSLDMRGCAADTGDGCPDTDKHYVPAAYYIEKVAAGDGAVGSYTILQDWSDTPIIIE